MFAIVHSSEGWVVRNEETGRVTGPPCHSALQAQVEHQARVEAAVASLPPCNCGTCDDCHPWQLDYVPCDCHPWNPDAKPGDVDYRPGPDWPPSLNELLASRA